jgi:DNA-binding NarL/FixJ family response regulator
MRGPRVLIADDHSLIAELCRSLLLEQGFDVVGIVSDGHALVHSAAELLPDVVLVDIHMPHMNGLDAAEQIKKERPAVKVLFLTVDSDPELVAEAFRRGGSGYLLKTCAVADLVTAVGQVLRGYTYLYRSLPKEEIEFLRRRGRERPEGADLTIREREILQLLAEGKAMKEVGAILNITTRTVAFHKYRMMERLAVRTSADLVRYAIRNHLLAA